MEATTESFEKFGLVFVPIRSEYTVRHILLDRGVIVDFNTEEARKSFRFKSLINDSESEFMVTHIEEKNLFGQHSWDIQLIQLVPEGVVSKELKLTYPSDDIPFMRYKRGGSIPKKDKSLRIAA